METPLCYFEGAVVRLAVAFHHDSSRQLLRRSAELTYSAVACKDVRFRLNYLLDLAIKLRDTRSLDLSVPLPNLLYLSDLVATLLHIWRARDDAKLGFCTR